MTGTTIALTYASVFAIVIVAAACAPTRIPPDIPIRDSPVTPPGSDIPPVLAAFSGRWVGQWSDGREFRSGIAVVVHRIYSPTAVTVTFGCGVPSSADRFCPGSWPFTASFESNALVVANTGGGHRLVLTLRGRHLWAELYAVSGGQRLMSGGLSKLPSPPVS
jgi:hypothetical protein